MNNRVTILVELLLSVTLFFVYTQPMYSNTIVNLNKRIAQIETAQAAARQYVGAESHLQTQFAKISNQDHIRLNTFLPSTPLGVHLLYNIKTLASNSHITLSKFSTNYEQDTTNLNKKSSGPTIHTLVVSLTGTGSYKSFRTFLNGLEYSLRLIDVTRIKIFKNNNATVASLGNAPARYAYSLTLNVYWLSSSPKT